MADSRIDLSRLPPPEIPGLLQDSAALVAAYRQWLDDTYDWQVAESASDPAYRLLATLAGREALMRRAIADAAASATLAHAKGVLLDHIGVTYARLARHAGESDEGYRQRCADAPDLFAVGLSAGWYESTARAVPGVGDARLVRTAPGFVTIWILAAPDGDSDQVPPQALLDAVSAVVTSDDAEQHTDVVTVSAGSRVVWDARLTLTLRPGPVPADEAAAARARIERLGADLARLGAGVHPEVVAGAAVDAATTADAAVVLWKVDVEAGSRAEVSEIAGASGVAPLLRTAEVVLA